MPQLECAASDPQGLLNHAKSSALRQHVCHEQMELEVLVRGGPQISLTHGGKDDRLRDRVGVEVVKLLPIVLG